MTLSANPSSGLNPPSAALAFEMPLAMRWRDLDAFDHVNNANYLTYLEEARIRWFQSTGRAWVNDQFAPLLAAAQLNYRRPIPYPADVVIKLFVDRIGTTSITIGHRIESADGRTLYCDGHVVAVWIDRSNGKPRPLPATVLQMAASTMRS